MAERSRIVLVGAGHAHLHLMHNRHRLSAESLTVVDPGAFWYSGMVAGVLGTSYRPVEDRLDPKGLARRHAFTLVRGRATGLDLSRRQLGLHDGRTLPFDLLSLNLGSSVFAPPTSLEGPQVWTVKPIQQLVALRRRLERAFLQKQQPHIVVVGGGASGVELACNVRALAARCEMTSPITLVTRQQLLPFAPPGARLWLKRHLVRLDISVRHATQAVAHHRRGLLVAKAGQSASPDTLELLECDHVIHASGLTPPGVLEQLGLALLPERGLAVRNTLQSVDDPDIFAAGDCAALVEHVLPRLGVHGVRQAPVLLANLEARLRGQSPRDYVPQATALTILNLGQGRGLAIRGRLWWAGRLSLRWKRWLDERFMSRYRA